MNDVIRPLSADKKALYIDSDTTLTEGTVDILIDGRRVWSVASRLPDDKGRIRFNWPKALQPYLNGHANLTVQSSATGEMLAEGAVRIGRAKRDIEVKDEQGRWLAMNKWARLGPSFEGNDTGVQARLLSSAQRLVADLQELDYPVFIVGGTLLGAVRSGALLPHDDDIDLAWVCRETNPLDISLASMAMERALVERGYTSIRLSMAHLQITFFDDAGRTDHYVDIFTGFFMDGQYGQPFALRGELDPTDLEPIGSITLNDVPFPAPAKPEAWLEFAYGPHWLVPDPSFRFVTPRSTIRRFENWFGVFNRGRVFWEKRFEKLATRPTGDAGIDEIDALLSLLPGRAGIVDLGSGDGRLTERIAQAGHTVTGVDYSYEALRLAREDARDGVEYRYLNFNDRRELLDFGFDLMESRTPWFFSATHVLESVPKQGRENLFLFLGLVLREGTFAYATFDTDFTRRYKRGQPDTWHYPIEWLERESAPFGLTFEVIRTGHRSTRVGRRATATVIIRRDASKRIVDRTEFEQSPAQRHEEKK